MAVIIDATLGGTDSNSYVLLTEADTYFQSRLNVTKWTGATPDEKNRALVQSTRRVDYEDFYGSIVDESQALSFPRNGMGRVNGRLVDGIIPRSIKESTYELALYMLSVDMSQVGDNNSGLSEYSVKVGSIEETKKYESGGGNEVEDFNDLPPFVESLLEPFSNTVSSGGVLEVSR